MIGRVRWSAVGIAVSGLLAGALTVFAAPSQASPLQNEEVPSIATADDFAPAAVGQPVRAKIYRATLYQCPGTHCNQGEVSPPDDARLVCKLDGYAWVLVLNRTTGHVGWIDRQWLSGIQYEPLSCYATGIPTWPSGERFVIYQCPSYRCNTGIVEKFHGINVYCRLSGTDWNFLFNTVYLHVGWARSYTHGGSVPPPC